ncbi:MAG: Holliday junction resolvase RuvX [Candidatus Eisenbacteria bacterium]|nr:Holliday junction resolvase RuvX [Candidatus Eisenbacteria bacterium]
MAVVIGIDLGDRRVGVSVSDPTGTIAFPLPVLDGSDRPALLRAIEDLVKERGAERVVIGLPRNMNGSLGERAEITLAFREELAARIDVPVDTWDERLSSAQAERVIRAGEGRETEKGGRPRRHGGRPRRGQEKGRIDRIAAVLILQSWLDRNASGPSEWDEGGTR